MKKLLSVIFVLAMFALCLASCNEIAVTTAAPGGNAAAPKGLPTAEEAAAMGLAGDFNILVSGNFSACNDLDSSTYEDLLEPTVVDEAVYERNELLKSTYGINVTVENVMKFGSTTGSGTGFQKISNAYVSGLTTYDAAAIGTYDVATLSYNGMLRDLNKVEYLDLTQEYWDQKAVEDLSVMGKLYFVCGDISMVNNKVTHAILFNKDMAKTYKITDENDPYTLVKENKWTLEKLTELVKKVGEDRDSNGIYDANDLYGLMIWKDPSVAILSSSGKKIAGTNANGEIEYTLMDGTVVDLYDKYTDLANDTAHVFNYQYDNVTGKQAPQADWDKNRVAIFNDSRALFYLNTVYTIESHRSSDVDFGVLPYPKYTESQEDYGHGVSPYHSQFTCVPVMVANPQRSGIVLEFLAKEGQKSLRPAYYDITLQGKSVRDQESAAMLDIIFASRVFDIGAYYNVGDIKTEIGNMTVTKKNITNIDATLSEVANTQIEQLNDAFAKLQY
ncbi:MAG: extracellular solute-binding protein [Clostridia bacterium]|nr:extracellular solute-binding protein [Clostridia bacterium]